MTKYTKDYIKKNIPYYGKIKTKGRYKGIKAKAWGILSDYVRIRDFIKYGTCVATGQRIDNWNDTDAGHFITMGGHGVQLGFHPFNVHAQSKNSNRQSGADEGADFERELVKRYGQSTVNLLRKMKNDAPIKADDWFFLKKIKDTHILFTSLRIKYRDFDYPDYIKLYPQAVNDN